MRVGVARAYVDCKSNEVLTTLPTHCDTCMHNRDRMCGKSSRMQYGKIRTGVANLKIVENEIAVEDEKKKKRKIDRTSKIANYMYN